MGSVSPMGLLSRQRLTCAMDLFFLCGMTRAAGCSVFFLGSCLRDRCAESTIRTRAGGGSEALGSILRDL